MKTLILAALAIGTAASALAQAPATNGKIKVVVEARSEGRATPDEAAARLLADVRRGLDTLEDVQVVPRDEARRTIWIVVGTTAGSYAASMMVTEQYDRQTLMVLGIEDDDTAERMMAMQMVNDHQIFTDTSATALARRIVTAIDQGVIAKLRTVRAKRPPAP